MPNWTVAPLKIHVKLTDSPQSLLRRWHVLVARKNVTPRDEWLDALAEYSADVRARTRYMLARRAQNA